jgi:hypothetical protein
MPEDKILPFMKRIKAMSKPEQAWRINSFKQLGFTDPLLPTKTFDLTLDFIMELDFDTPIYPSFSTSGPPRCIFLPTTVLLERMMMAVIRYGGEKNFFNRFGMT